MTTCDPWKPLWISELIEEMAREDVLLHACIEQRCAAPVVIELLAEETRTLRRELIEARTNQRTVTLLCTEEERRRWCMDDKP